VAAALSMTDRVVAMTKRDPAANDGQGPDHREASVITFLATASGMSFLGLGSAFWGVIIGGFAYLVLNKA